MKWIARQWSRVRRVLPRVRDIAAILICLAIAVDTAVLRYHHSAPLAVLEGVLCGGAALTLWWRRQHPLGVVLVTLGVTVVTGVAGALFFAIATLIVRRRDRVTALLSGASVLAFFAGQRLTLLHSTINNRNAISDLINIVLIVGLIVAASAYIGVRRDLVTNLKDRAERAEAEREIREERGRLNERTRIAREMHDVLAHKVSLIALQAGGLEVTNDLSPATVRNSAALIRQTARQALEDLRDVLGVLRDENGDVRTSLAPQATLADIASLVAASRQAGQPVTLTGSADLSRPAADLVGRAAYRLVQEALTNVNKHARSAATTVRIDGAPGDRLDIEVTNLAPVGAGQLLPGSGLGLVGLRERIELVGGTFSAGPTTTGGFNVRACLPWSVDVLATTSGPT